MFHIFVKLWNCLSFFLILLNGLFAMSEIAMVSSRKSRLEAASKRGDLAAKKLWNYQKIPESFFLLFKLELP